MNTSINQASPRPFREIPGLWLKIFRMDETFFNAEAPRASGWNTLWVVIIYAVIVLLGFTPVELKSVSYLDNYFAMHSPASKYLVPIILVVPCLIMAFYLGIGLMAVGAGFFGARGADGFKTLAYLVSLFYVPTCIIASLILFSLLILPFYINHPSDNIFLLIDLIPWLWLLIPLGCPIFGMVLSVRAVKAAYKMSSGRAVGAVLTPPVVFLILPLGTIVILALLGPAVSTEFTNVVQNI